MAKLKCKICGKEVDSLTRHLQYTHKMSKAKYTEAFGDTVFTSPELQQKMKRVQNPARSAYNKKVYWQQRKMKEITYDDLPKEKYEYKGEDKE